MVDAQRVLWLTVKVRNAGRQAGLNNSNVGSNPTPDTKLIGVNVPGGDCGLQNRVGWFDSSRLCQNIVAVA